jgi:meso-butanediol dehydrogenase / (S,S)-butanediol dehydrogenase / diacetyl reductase
VLLPTNVEDGLEEDQLMGASMTSPFRVAVVTGGARGIGLATVQWFLVHGHRVALWDIDAATLTRTVSELNDAERVLGIHCDVSKPEQVQAAAVQTWERYGRIDALVNNAGVAVFKPIGDTTFDDWNHVLGTNLNGPFLCAQAIVPFMRSGRWGAIVNIASISGLRASTLRIAYGTSKAAVIHLTKQQAVELGTVGIRVNCVAPGPVDTEMAKLVHSVAIRADYHDVIPLNRYGTTEEVADAVGYLCSDAASYINGQVLAVDGGFEAAGVGLPTLRRNAAGEGA